MQPNWRERQTPFTLFPSASLWDIKHFINHTVYVINRKTYRRYLSVLVCQWHTICWLMTAAKPSQLSTHATVQQNNSRSRQTTVQQNTSIYLFHRQLTASNLYSLSMWAPHKTKCNSVRPSLTRVLYCFVTNPKNLWAIFLYYILITANMQSKTDFPNLKFAACCPVSSCWPSCFSLPNLSHRRLDVYVRYLLRVPEMICISRKLANEQLIVNPVTGC